VRCCIRLSLDALAPLLPSAARVPLWDEQAGDNNNLMSLFTPPMEQQPHEPAQTDGLEAWQAQKAIGEADQQQHQHMAAGARSATTLLQQFVTLLSAASQEQAQGGAASSQQPHNDVPQNPFQNMYGAPAAPSRPAGDVALLQSAAASDEPLPLAPRGMSSYLFSVPPADVAAKRRRAAPKVVSDLTLFSRIPRHVQPGRTRGPVSASESRMRNNWFSLEKQFQSAPRRRIQRRAQQKKFFLKTRHMRRPIASHLRAGQQRCQQCEETTPSNRWKGRRRHV
jgi:hypothetical protein